MRSAGGRGLAALGIALLLAATAEAGDSRPRPGDDRTFRPTVLVRKGPAQGSGTIIASTGGETLVLTASHVVEGDGRLTVELHRYNLGVERFEPRGTWPKSIRAEVAASDMAADLAILRIRGMVALPYVARLAPGDGEPPRGTAVTSIGIDLGTRLCSWPTRIAEVDRFEIDGREQERRFLVTVHPPEHGRSGGGLFLDDGALVGVCIGRAQMVKGRESGVFASGESIRRLLREHSLDAVVARPPGGPGPRRAPVTATGTRPSP